MNNKVKVSKRKIKMVADKIAKEYKPEKIILFGSYAWGTPHPDSDVDLLIIKETRDPLHLSRDIDGTLFPRPFPLDLLVFTPRQVKQRESMGDFFIQDILSKGKVLYAK